MDMLAFAQRLRATRIAQNVIVKDMADATGISMATLFRYEHAEGKSVKTETLQAIADYLNVNPDYLIGATDDKRPTAQKATPDITSEEELLLQLFRQVPADHRQAVLEQFAVDVVRYALKHNQ
jgi:transcriptional regulator with XRE-family HTH domain